MKAKLQYTLAVSVALVAAFLAGAGSATADGMGRAPAAAYATPAQWSGFYAGVESGWEWETAEFHSPVFNTSAHWDRDNITAGFFGGYQHQFGSVVVGVEFSLIGNEFNDSSRDRAPEGPGNCPDRVHNCIGRITDVFTVGPRLGWAAGNWMPYVTGGYASGSINMHVVNPAITGGTSIEIGDVRTDGYYVGGGLDWKLAPYAVVGIEYRHTDLGWDTMHTFVPQTGAVGPDSPLRARADSDAILFRGSLLFNPPRAAAAPLK
jgi:outer membrane immunogenic protein